MITKIIHSTVFVLLIRYSTPIHIYTRFPSMVPIFFYLFTLQEYKMFEVPTMYPGRTGKHTERSFVFKVLILFTFNSLITYLKKHNSKPCYSYRFITRR